MGVFINQCKIVKEGPESACVDACVCRVFVHVFVNNEVTVEWFRLSIVQCSILIIVFENH